MKELPDEKKLLELLALAKDFERKAREMSEVATKIAYKWQKKAEAKRQAVKPQSSSSEVI